MKSRLAVAALGALLCACAPILPFERMSIEAPWDQGDASRRMAVGTGAISGSALIRQRGGGIVTCAGREVRLIPETAYGKERVAKVFGVRGGEEKSFLPVSNMKKIEFSPEASEFKSFTKSSVCDPQGSFRFQDLRAGEYYVVVSIVWQIGIMNEGGMMFQRVVIAEGESKSVVLAP